MSSKTIPYDELTRRALAKSFIENVMFAQYRQLTNWQKVTQQTSQIDSGYLGQHLVSLISGTPGRGPGSRGKGHDLVDGSEIKVASSLGGVDTPRWNHSGFTNEAKVNAYLGSRFIYFVLYDTPAKSMAFPLRIRVWRVAPRTDTAFSSVVRSWARGTNSGNFQLHPPCWDIDSSVTTNKCGNLRLPLIFKAVQRGIEGVDFMDVDTWRLRAGKSKTVAR